MRSILTLIITLLALCLLAGCGPSQTRAEFESDHPYAKQVTEIPANSPDALTVVIYRDNQPDIDFGSPGFDRVYHLNPGQHVLAERHKAEIAQAEAKRLADEKATKEHAEREAAAKAASAPERAKITALALSLTNLPMPTMTSEAGKALIKQARGQAEKFARWLESEGAKL
jgi:ABC-type oligopeptide transport system substrate-binding subunit